VDLEEEYMNAITRAAMAALIILSFSSVAAAADAPQPRVVASTSWIAAIARAAGATDVVTLAAMDLRHPAEYELKPSDIAVVQGAGLVLYSGFEVMAKKLAEYAGSAGAATLQIGADYSLATLRASILAVATALDTMAKARESIAALEDFVASWKTELGSEGMLGAPVIVHVFQKPLADELGFSVKGVFGPAPLEAAQIVRLSGSGAVLIVDNWHNEVASPLRETMKAARYASLVNFPGVDGTVSLLDVLRENRARLAAVIR
jgi:zinc transport system substrate-binding protein